jgi:hypothetical protein
MHKTEKSKITKSAESRDANSNPWDHNLGFGQANPGNTSSEKIPEVWKNQPFTGMIFTIEKCRDLK